jgi:hypothetical protein
METIVEGGMTAMHRCTMIALFVSVIIVTAFVGTTGAASLGTGFTYQGKLTDSSGLPLSGSYSMNFKLFDAASGGVQVGSTVTLPGVAVSGGLFTVNLDFGPSAFNGRKLWIETSVGTQVLSPRVEITSVPSAIYAQSVADGSVASDDIAAGALSNYKGNIQALANGSVNPAVVGSVATNGVPQSLAVSGRYVYVISNGGNNYSLQVIDVSNPSSPTTVGSGITGVGTELQQIAVSGSYVYATNPASRRLRIIDVSNPSSPVVTGDVTTATTSNNPTSVAVSGRYAYVTGLSGARFQSVDISNPASPIIAAAGPTGPAGGDALRSVTVSGRYAYTVDSSANRLYIFDISNPSSITAVGNVVTNTTPCAVAVSGRYAYVINSGSYTLQVFDVSNPASPTLAGSMTPGGTPTAIAVSGRYACVVRAGGNTLQVFEVSNPASIGFVGSVTTGSGPCAVAISGRYAYVANNVSNTMQVIDITGIESTSMNAHSLEAGTLQVRGNAMIANQLSVAGGLNVGIGGLFSAGSIATSKVAYFGANVGIGTQSPGQQLQVDAGDILVRGTGNFSGAGQEARLYLGDTNNYIKAVNNGGLRIGTYNGADDIALSNDKVGIGTTSPVAKLQVEGAEVSDADNLYGPLAIKETTNTVDTPAGRTVLGLKRPSLWIRFNHCQ